MSFHVQRRLPNDAADPHWRDGQVRANATNALCLILFNLHRVLNTKVLYRLRNASFAFACVEDDERYETTTALEW